MNGVRVVNAVMNGVRVVNAVMNGVRVVNAVMKVVNDTTLHTIYDPFYTEKGSASWFTPQD